MPLENNLLRGTPLEFNETFPTRKQGGGRTDYSHQQNPPPATARQQPVAVNRPAEASLMDNDMMSPELSAYCCNLICELDNTTTYLETSKLKFPGSID